MRYNEYSDIIFEGLQHHKKYFEPYILRCLKKAEKDFVTDFEFLNRLADVMKDYESELYKCFLHKLEDFNSTLTIENVNNGMKLETPKLPLIDIRQLQKNSTTSPRAKSCPTPYFGGRRV